MLGKITGSSLPKWLNMEKCCPSAYRMDAAFCQHQSGVAQPSPPCQQHCSPNMLNHRPEDSQPPHSRIFIQVLWLIPPCLITQDKAINHLCAPLPCHCRQWMHHVGALLISILWWNALWIPAEAVITAVGLIRCCVSCPQLPRNSLS